MNFDDWCNFKKCQSSTFKLNFVCQKSLARFCLFTFFDNVSFKGCLDSYYNQLQINGVVWIGQNSYDCHDFQKIQGGAIEVGDTL